MRRTWYILYCGRVVQQKSGTPTLGSFPPKIRRDDTVRGHILHATKRRAASLGIRRDYGTATQYPSALLPLLQKLERGRRNKMEPLHSWRTTRPLVARNVVVSE